MSKVVMALAWLATAPINYCATYALYDKGYPALRNTPHRASTLAARAIIVAATGPAGLLGLVSYCLTTLVRRDLASPRRGGPITGGV